MYNPHSDITHPILRFVQNAEKMSSQEEILSGFTEILAAYHIHFIIYVTVNQNKAASNIWSNINIHENPNSDNFFDPFLKYCCTTYAPTYTGIDFLNDYPYLTAEEKAFIQSAGAMGFRTGLAIPINLENTGRFGGFNLGTSLDKQTFLDTIPPLTDKLSLACVLLNQKLEALYANSSPSPYQEKREGDQRPNNYTLTSRERDMLFLLTQGQSRKGMARISGLSLNTISSYIKSIYTKIGVTNRSEATRVGLKMGLKPPRFSNETK